MTQSNYNNNLSLLPFYESIGEQDRRRPYAYGETYALFTPLGSVPPFQVMLDYGQAPRVMHVYLYRSDGTMVRDIKGELEDGGMFSFYTNYGIERLSVCYPSIAPQTITEEELTAQETNADEKHSDQIGDSDDPSAADESAAEAAEEEWCMPRGTATACG